MGKKRSRTSQTSKGERSSVNKKLCNSLRREYVGTMQQLLNQQSAWRAGKNVVLTIHNPNKKETNKPFIRVNARDHWGNPHYVPKKKSA